MLGKFIAVGSRELRGHLAGTLTANNIEAGYQTQASHKYDKSSKNDVLYG